MEEDEKRTYEELSHAETIAAHCGTRKGCVIHKHILKARNAGVAIVRDAEEQAVDLILLANNPVRVRGTTQQIDPVVEYVMKNAPCEVLVLSGGHADAIPNKAVEANGNDTAAQAEKIVSR